MTHSSSEMPQSSKAAPLPTSSSSVAVALNAVGVLDVLGRCCANSAPAVIVLPEQGGFFQARFASLSQKTVSFDLFPEQSPDALKPSSLCSVSFIEGGTTCVFMASIREARAHAPKQIQLVLDLPAGIARGEARRAHRYPVYSDSGLRVRVLTSNHQEWRPEAVDISLCGIQLDFPPDDQPEFYVGAPCEVLLQLDNTSVELTGEVRRRNGRRYGLLFPETIQDGAIVAPNALRTIVQAIERKFRQRADLLDQAILSEPTQVLMPSVEFPNEL